MDLADARERRWALVFLYAFFGFYFLLTFLLYLDRFFADTAHYLHYIISKGTLFIAHTRWSAGIPQLLPLAGTWCGVSLNGLIRLYSVSFCLEYFLIFMLLAHGMRNISMSVVLVLLLTCGASKLFYWPISEIQQALAWSVLYYAMLRNLPNAAPPKKFGSIGLVMVVVLFFHPLTAIYTSYATVLDALQRRRLGPRHGVLLGISGLFFIIRNLLASPFEKGRMQELGGNILHVEYLSNMMKQIVAGQPALLILVAVLTVVWLVRREYLKLAFVWICWVGYFLFINFTNQPAKGWFPEFYVEHIYLPLVFVVCVPLLEAVTCLPEVAKRTFKLTIGAIIVIHSLAIFPHRHFFTERREMLLRIMHAAARQGRPHVIINHYNFRYQWTWFSEPFPKESLMLSAMTPDLPQTMVTTDLYYSRDPSPAREELSDYYALAQGPYEFMSTEASIEKFNELDPARIGLTPYVHGAVKAGSTLEPHVRITNANNTPIPSGIQGPCKPFLSYRWLLDGKPVNGEQSRTALECDVVDYYIQPMRIVTPSKSAVYELCVDIVLENHRWLGVSSSIFVEVK